MSDIQFDEENIGLYRANTYMEEKSKIFKFVESFGVPEKYVGHILISFLIIALGIIIFFFFHSNIQSPPPTISSEKIINKQQFLPPGTR